MPVSLRLPFEPLAERIGRFSTKQADPLRRPAKPGLPHARLKTMGCTTPTDRGFGLDTSLAVCQGQVMAAPARGRRRATVWLIVEPIVRQSVRPATRP